MKQLIFGLFLVASTLPLFAGDEGGDGPEIPSYTELVREGYGPTSQEQTTYYSIRTVGLVAAPKPTMAYYGRGYTIYYGYTPIKIAAAQANTVYAFGHPVSYFWHLTPTADPTMSLDNYAVQVTTPAYGEGNAIAQRGGNAITTVQSTTPAKTGTPAIVPAGGPAQLPAIGEKPPTH